MDLENELRFSGVYRDNLPEITKDGAYITNFGEYPDVSTHCMLYIVRILKLFISEVLELNMFLKKIKSLLGIKA